MASVLSGYSSLYQAEQKYSQDNYFVYLSTTLMHAMIIHVRDKNSCLSIFDIHVINDKNASTRQQLCPSSYNLNAWNSWTGWKIYLYITEIYQHVISLLDTKTHETVLSIGLLTLSIALSFPVYISDCIIIRYKGIFDEFTLSLPAGFLPMAVGFHRVLPVFFPRECWGLSYKH